MALQKTIISEIPVTAIFLSPTELELKIAHLRATRMHEADKEFRRTLRELKRISQLFHSKTSN